MERRESPSLSSRANSLLLRFPATSPGNTYRYGSERIAVSLFAIRVIFFIADFLTSKKVAIPTICAASTKSAGLAQNRPMSVLKYLQLIIRGSGRQ
jgi:hypothetical protein